MSTEDEGKDRQGKHLDRVAAIADDIRVNEAEQTRTEAMVTARAISLAGLPRRKVAGRDLSRTLRLGTDLWLRVTYSTGVDGVLPFGEDRFVLAGIQHLALERKSPIVLFDEVSELLKLFGLSTDGSSLRRLRERFKRIEGLTIRLEFAETEAALRDAPSMAQGFVIERAMLPTREEIVHARIGKTSLPRLFEDESSQRVHYGVVLSDYFWKHLQDEKNHLILRLDILKNFVDRPTGWDYYTFLAYRCAWAKSWSPVPHEALMSLFKDNPKDQDSKTIDRIQKYHDEVMVATAGNLKAELKPAGQFPTDPKKGGRPKERWELWVGPSKPIVWSGKQGELFPNPDP